MREADNKSCCVFLSVVGVYVVRTSSLNDKHSCQLFRKASSVVLLSSLSPRCFFSRVFLFFYFRILSSILSLSFLCSVSGVLFTVSFSFLSERNFFVMIKLL